MRSSREASAGARPCPGRLSAGRAGSTDARGAARARTAPSAPQPARVRAEARRAAADLVDRRCRFERSVHLAGSRDEQLACVAGRERRHRESVLGLDPQSLTTRDDDGRPFGLEVRRDALRHVGQKMLRVVEEEDKTLASCRRRETSPISRPACSATPSALAVVAGTTAGSRSAASGTHHNPSGNSSAASATACSASRVFPVPPGPVSVTRRTSRRVTSSTTSLTSDSATEERRRRNGQVRPVERLERREVTRTELEHPLLRGEILEAVHPEIEQRLAAGELCSRGGHDCLPAVRGGCDASRPVQVGSDIAAVRQQRRARVHSDTHPDRRRRGAPREPRRPRRARPAPSRTRRRTHRPECRPRRRRSAQTHPASSGDAHRAPRRNPRRRAHAAASSSLRCR